MHSVDVSPSQQGLANLKGTGVGVIGLKSTEAAKKWAEEGGTPIDLLFIDADHSLDSVVGDFNGWAPFLRAGATVIFHDYDPIERGGLKHLGVKIGVDTIIRRGLIGEAEHAYKLVYGSVAKRESMQVSTRDCRDTLARLARHIVEVRDGDHRGRDLVVDDRFAYLLKGCMKIDPDAQPVGPQRALDAARTYLVSAHPDGLLPAMLRQHGVPDASVTVIDSLIACYILDHALTHHFDHLVAQDARQACLPLLGRIDSGVLQGAWPIRFSRLPGECAAGRHPPPGKRHSRRASAAHPAGASAAKRSSTGRHSR